jgi:trans-aconitate methyltransferase
MKWDPAKYVQFGDHRDRPFFDLTGRVDAESPMQVVDLGCGPGNLTATLAERWPEADVVGLDCSAEMLAKAEAVAEGTPCLRFALMDLTEWMPSAETGVVVSNAALQWVPGHQDMMRSWLAALRPGSWFAMQVPGNFNAPSHALMRGLAGSSRWAPNLRGVLQGGESVGEPATTFEYCSTPASRRTRGRRPTSRCCPARIQSWNGSAVLPSGPSWRSCRRRRAPTSRPNMRLPSGRPTRLARTEPSFPSAGFSQ